MNIDWLNSVLVSISMSVDCMTVGVTDGIKEPDMKKRKITLLAFFFGLFQYLMPTIGYFIFYLVINYGLNESITKSLTAFIPWIAFVLLSLLGIKNIVEWWKERKEEKEYLEENKKKNVLGFKEIIVQSVATSIDALCIGFVYSPLQYSILNSQIIFSMIGGITFILSFFTTFFGKKIGKHLIDWAELIAGIIFIAIGIKILLESYLG